MNKVLILMVGLVILLALPMVSAQDETYSLLENVSIERSCFNSNNSDGECSASTQCRITLFRANSQSDTLVINANMTNIKPVHNYTINGSLLDTVGLYRYDIVCVDGAINNFNSFEFTLTPSGSPPISEGQSTILFLVLGVMIFISVIFFIMGFTSKNIVMKVAGFSGGVITTFILILYNMLLLDETISSVPNLIGGYETFLFVMKMVGTVLILGLVVISFLVLAKAWKIKRGLVDK